MKKILGAGSTDFLSRGKNANASVAAATPKMFV
jgi:hypothetical protein